MMTANHLRAEGVVLSWLPELRAALLGIGIAWSAWLGLHIIKAGSDTPSIVQAGLLWPVPVVAVTASWIHVFYIW